MSAGFPLSRLTHGFMADVRLAARRLYATPFFTAFAILSLAVGIGVTTAFYSVVDALFLKDLGMRDPDRIIFVATPYDERMRKGTVSRPDFEDLRGAQTTFSSMSATALFRTAIELSSNAELVLAEAVDGAYFSTLGVGAHLGRVFHKGDDQGGARVAVLSHLFWKKRFGGNPRMLGQTLRLSGVSFQVIGVADADFDGINGVASGTKIWVHHNALDADSPLSPRGSGQARDHRQLVVFGRLAPSATEEAAEAQLALIATRLDASYPAPGVPEGFTFTERPWKTKSAAAINRDDNFVRRLGLTLMGLVALVLVVACTNLANLVLARGTTRRQEFAVRSALGASRFRLIREQCAESLLLALTGGLASAAVFHGLRVFLESEFTVGINRGERLTITILPTLNLTVVGIAAASLLFSLAVFGLEPALSLTKTRNLTGELTEGAAGLGSPRATRQGRLLRFQVAISTAFFIIATLLVRFLVEEARHDPGVEMGRLAVAVLNFEAQGWSEGRIQQTLDRVLQEVAKDQAIEQVSASTGMPFGVRSGMRISLVNPGVRGSDARDAYDLNAIGATESIFKTLGVRLLRGRGFDDRERSNGAPVLVLSDFAARRLFGTSDVVGRHVTLYREHSPSLSATVIGVAADTDVGRILMEPRGLAYLPLALRKTSFLSIAARSRDHPATAVQALRAALHRVDPDLPIDIIGAGREVLAGPWELLRALGASATALGTLTLVLAMVGLFGIQSHIVARRTREIGVRMALGATARQIKRMVLVDGYRPVFEGLVLGLFMGFTGRAIVRSYMDVNISVIDPWTLLVVPIPLFLAAYCACYLPASRAAAVDPSMALRSL